MKRAIYMLPILLGCVACENPQRRETESLSRALERFRLAEDADQAREAKNLESLTVTDAEVTRVKRTCVDAAKDSTDGMALVAEAKPLVAKVSLGALAKDSPEALALGPKLDRADALLRKGKDEMTRCDSEISALKRKVGL